MNLIYNRLAGKSYASNAGSIALPTTETCRVYSKTMVRIAADGDSHTRLKPN